MDGDPGAEAGDGEPAASDPPGDRRESTSSNDVDGLADGPGSGEGAGTTAAPSTEDPDRGFQSTEAEDLEAIDPSELTVEQRSLDPRIRTIWIARTVLVGLVLGAIAAAALFSLGVPLALAIAVVPVPAIVFLPLPILRYRIWRYEIREDAIYLERGVITRVRTVVPYVRIQHVDTSRGPLARAVGLATVVVYTAGSRGADVTISGLALSDARDHQQRLKRLAIASEDDTSV